MVSDEEVQYLELRVQQLEQMVTTLLSAPPPAPAADPAGDDSDFLYPNVEAWILEEFVPVHARPIGGEFRWCLQWWDHVEAVSRFEALWKAWEKLRLDPVFGMAVWYRDYLDISLPMITGPRGPFARCSPERHEPLKTLPIQPAPENHWGAPLFDGGNFMSAFGGGAASVYGGPSENAAPSEYSANGFDSASEEWPTDPGYTQPWEQPGSYPEQGSNRD